MKFTKADSIQNKKSDDLKERNFIFNILFTHIFMGEEWFCLLENLSRQIILI